MACDHEQGSLWTEGAGSWEELFEPQRVPLYEAILDSCGADEGMHVLDAGCGSGGLAQRATLRGATVSGFDISDGMVALAQQNMPQGDFRVGGVDASPFEDAKFDIVIACDCLFFADDVVAAVEELSRVCKKNSTIAIIVWELPEKSDYSTYYAAMQAALPAPPKISPFALSEEGVLEELVKKAGLKFGEVRSISLDYRFSNIEQFWQAAKKFGIIQNMIHAAGEKRIRDAAYSGSAPAIRPSGEVLFRHAYRVVIAHS